MTLVFDAKENRMCKSIVVRQGFLFSVPELPPYEVWPSRESFSKVDDD